MPFLFAFCIEPCYNFYKKGEVIMVILITGASHTGKTTLAATLVKKYGYSCISLDLLKMGLIRSKNTSLTPFDDSELTSYLWPIAREIIKTAIENNQHLIIEGCYIPLDWDSDFKAEYLKEIKFYCLCMTERYIVSHFDDIKKYASVTEKRKEDSFTIEEALSENAQYLSLARKAGKEVILIDESYPTCL